MALGSGRAARTRPRRKNGTLAPNDATLEELAKPDDRPWQFKKGVSPNPGGKPKALKVFRDLLIERTAGGEKLEELISNIAFGLDPTMTDPRVRWCAIERSADVLWGRVKHTVALTDGVPAEPSPPVPLDALLQVLDDKDRTDLERILVNFEMAKRDGRLALPEPPQPDVEDAEVQ